MCTPHAERLAAADPTNIEWQHDLSVSRERLGALAVAAGGTGAAAEHYQHRPGHRRAAGRRRPDQHRMANGLVA
jgi:hypothetical protein